MLTMTELGDREFYAAMTMQGIISRENLPADEAARQAVAYAEALILAIEANAYVPRMASTWKLLTHASPTDPD